MEIRYVVEFTQRVTCAVCRIDGRLRVSPYRAGCAVTRRGWPSFRKRVVGSTIGDYVRSLEPEFELSPADALEIAVPVSQPSLLGLWTHYGEV